MIPFDFEYYQPQTAESAASTFHKLEKCGKEPRYYGGGTEIISMARVGNLYAGAVVDIKGIPECRELGFRQDELVIGSGVTLTQIAESGLFPLLGKCAGRVADHTIQGKITLGGNLAGTIIYREASLPLLLADTNVVVQSPDSRRTVPLTAVYDGEMHLAPGEFLLQFLIPREFTELPYVHVKRTKADKIDYPLVTVAALRRGDRLRFAFSGLVPKPFRSTAVEGILNNRLVHPKERVDAMLRALPEPVLADNGGSPEYRAFVLKTILLNTFDALEGA
ncbi:MAG: FAD binding domain-containing protein [Solirubrobacterales bacterium]